MSWLKRHRLQVQLSAIVLWLAFTVTFALWWLVFSIDNITHLAVLEPLLFEHWHRQRRMVLWEGGTWLVLLIIGAAALIVLVQRETARARRIREFFASFSHEVKTSLASLRLQAEALQDEAQHSHNPILGRLISDTVRLQLQLENSLFLASTSSVQLFVQPLRLSDLVERMSEQWPGLKVELNRSSSVKADDRALRTILSNVMQNARVHGRASKVKIEVTEVPNGRLRVRFEDDGAGFKGDAKLLGRLFSRPVASSGSGLGLYISRELARKMGGDFNWIANPDGFVVTLELEGQLL